MVSLAVGVTNSAASANGSVNKEERWLERSMTNVLANKLVFSALTLVGIPHRLASCVLNNETHKRGYHCPGSVIL